ncbi:MAG: transcriptional repressor [Alicyclobacillus herbarius]|uniref:Fur family transcriptional regulator n=1 Tax=Alicyclobacillus herbarius TaxID=122960 RepID=UPI00047E3663|nr:transcriptional repressor [Alicyclobacillus herbarius]MCL6633036.1 transcriptional repressor [Alicyclobacillus herbarius]
MQSLNMTAPRRAVLEVIRQSREHPTANDIMDILARRGERYAYATIYNSLRYLADHGLIKELNIGNGITRYDGRMEEHQHVVCSRCGAIAEADVDIPAELVQQIEAETGYKVHSLNVHLTGLCPACREKEQSGQGRD